MTSVLFPIATVLFFLIVYSLLRPPRPAKVSVAGIEVEMLPGTMLVIPQEGPIIIEGQLLYIPPGGAYFVMSTSGHMPMTPLGLPHG